MENNKKSITLILLAVCILIWTVNVIVDLVVTARPHRIVKLALDGAFLTAWISAFVVKWKLEKEEGEIS